MPSIFVDILRTILEHVDLTVGFMVESNTAYLAGESLIYVYKACSHFAC